MTLDYPGAQRTQLTGINNAGQIVGVSVVSGMFVSFLYDGGTFSVVDYPGSTATFACGINNVGGIAGDHNPGNGANGFVDDNGSFTSFRYPNSAYTEACGINDSGMVVGFYPAPEPSCLLLFLSGGLAVIGRLRSSSGRVP